MYLFYIWIILVVAHYGELKTSPRKLEPRCCLGSNFARTRRHDCAVEIENYALDTVSGKQVKVDIGYITVEWICWSKEYHAQRIFIGAGSVQSLQYETVFFETVCSLTERRLTEPVTMNLILIEMN